MKKFKYQEDEILEDLKDYITSTYGQHYVNKEGMQIQDFLHSIDLAIPFCQSNAIKYLGRFGKKDGMNKKDLYKAVHYTILLLHFTGVFDNDKGNQ